jgi:hypothetical protein
MCVHATASKHEHTQCRKQTQFTGRTFLVRILLIVKCMCALIVLHRHICCTHRGRKAGRHVSRARRVKCTQGRCDSNTAMSVAVTVQSVTSAPQPCAARYTSRTHMCTSHTTHAKQLQCSMPVCAALAELVSLGPRQTSCNAQRSSRKPPRHDKAKTSLRGSGER